MVHVSVRPWRLFMLFSRTYVVPRARGGCCWRGQENRARIATHPLPVRRPVTATRLVVVLDVGWWLLTEAAAVEQTYIFLSDTSTGEELEMKSTINNITSPSSSIVRVLLIHHPVLEQGVVRTQFSTCTFNIPQVHQPPPPSSKVHKPNPLHLP